MLELVESKKIMVVGQTLFNCFGSFGYFAQGEEDTEGQKFMGQAALIYPEQHLQLKKDCHCEDVNLPCFTNGKGSAFWLMAGEVGHANPRNWYYVRERLIFLMHGQRDPNNKGKIREFALEYLEVSRGSADLKLIQYMCSKMEIPTHLRLPGTSAPKPPVRITQDVFQISTLSCAAPVLNENYQAVSVQLERVICEEHDPNEAYYVDNVYVNPVVYEIDGFIRPVQDTNQSLYTVEQTSEVLSDYAAEEAGGISAASSSSSSSSAEAHLASSPSVTAPLAAVPSALSVAPAAKKARR
jgi:hypothetical protein